MQIPDKCSFEWAKKLYDSGYPVPAYAPGQLWYDKFGRPLLISAMYSSGVFQVTNMKTGDSGRVMDLRDGQIYAPGVDELVKEFFFEGPYTPNINYCFAFVKYRVFNDMVGKISESANLCDALAEAWLILSNTPDDEDY